MACDILTNLPISQQGNTVEITDTDTGGLPCISAFPNSDKILLIDFNTNLVLLSSTGTSITVLFFEKNSLAHVLLDASLNDDPT